MELSPELQDLKARASVDTGVFAREVLGFNYDETADPITGEVARLNVGSGGVRAEGPHQRCVSLLDGPERKVMIKLPRNCLKSTMAQAFLSRLIVTQPNIKIAYGMHNLDKATEKSLSIRNSLEENPLIAQLWSGGEPLRSGFWNQTRWTTSLRTDYSMAEPTFSVFSPEKPLTGGHYHVQVFDDILDDTWVETPRGLELTFNCWRRMGPMLLAGGKEVILCTRYSYADLYGYIEAEMEDLYEIVHYDCGMDIVEEEDGRITLDGESQFGTLTKDMIDVEIRKDFDFAVAQFWNKVSVGSNASFKIENLRVKESFQTHIEELSGWLLCDSATSDQDPNNCYSVVAYVGLDSAMNAYLLDLRVGHWHPSQFVDEWISCLSKWQRRCNHQGECIEKTTANDVYRASIEEKAQQQRLRLNIQTMMRNQNEPSKIKRITRLTSRWSAGKLIVVSDLIPRNFLHFGKEKLLWDPVGTVLDSGRRVPAGELVDEFVNFPKWRYMDIADALADIDAVDKDGERICYFREVPRSREMHKVSVGAEQDDWARTLGWSSR